MLLAIDTGGTKTLLGIFDEMGKLVETQKFPTPKDAKNYLGELTRAVEKIQEAHKLDIVSVAIPGVINNNIVKWAGGNLGWLQVDIPTTLKPILPKGTPVIVENDANLGGLGETRLQKKQPETALYITISTGIGTGVIAGGHIDPGMRKSETGHILIEYDGTLRRWESFASGQAIYKAYGKYAKDISSKKSWDQIADRISRGFLAVIPIIQPDIIIVGGSIGTHFDKFHPQLINILEEQLPGFIPCPKFIQATYPEQAVIYGCYFNAIDYLATQ